MRFLVEAWGGDGVSVDLFPQLLQEGSGKRSLHPCSESVCGGRGSRGLGAGSFLEARGRMPEAGFPKQFPGPGAGTSDLSSADPGCTGYLPRPHPRPCWPSHVPFPLPTGLLRDLLP